MSRVVSKHEYHDKWDAHSVSNKPFIQNNWHVAKYHECFSMRSAYGYHNRQGRGFKMGVDLKLPWATSHGICVDGTNVGKSDEP